MRAVLYCRVSTKEQTQNLSLPTQLKACREYCAREGYEIAREFMEQGESAKTTDRTQFKALLEYCRVQKPRVQIVVVYNIARFSRNSLNHAIVRAHLLKLGVSLKSATEPIDDTSTGQLVEGVLSVIAHFENVQKAERTKVGMKAALQLGRWTFKAPLGYLNATGTPSLIEDPACADTIKIAFTLIADGTRVSDVLRQINAAGLKGVSGRPLSLQSFRSILRNPLDGGRVKVPKLSVDRPVDFEPLVGESVFRCVQRRLDGSHVEPKHHVRDRDDFPLRRFLRCARCERSISASWSKGRTERYAYYHCPKCPGVRGRREAVENMFLSHMEHLKPEPGYLRLFRAIVLDVWMAEKDTARDVERLRAQRLDELRLRLDRLEEAFIFAKTIDHSVYERQRDRIQEQLALAELELQDARIETLDVEGILGFAERLIGNVGRMWMAAKLEQRQRIQAAIFPEGLPFDGGKFGTAATCLLSSSCRAPRIQILEWRPQAFRVGTRLPRSSMRCGSCGKPQGLPHDSCFFPAGNHGRIPPLPDWNR
jgi:site-specific DNA recombinase